MPAREEVCEQRVITGIYEIFISFGRLFIHVTTRQIVTFFIQLAR
jgi:hypothetical protein